MPGDGVNSIGPLDVQFGALDFGTEAFEMEPQSSPKSAPSAQPQSQPSPLANKYPTGVNAGGMDSAPTPASQASLDMDSYAKNAVLTQNLKVRFIKLSSLFSSSRGKKNIVYISLSLSLHLFRTHYYKGLSLNRLRPFLSRKAMISNHSLATLISSREDLVWELGSRL